jgi:glycine cleavage system H lipoate-binding protein
MRMLIDGRVVQINEVLLSERDLLLEQPESNRWIALIVPSRATKRLNLLTPKEYTEKNTVKYAA